MLPGQRARMEILKDAQAIIAKNQTKSKEQILTIIGVKLGLSHMKAREYYYDAVDYDDLMKNEGKTEEELEEEKAIEKIEAQLEHDRKVCGVKSKPLVSVSKEGCSL